METKTVGHTPGPWFITDEPQFGYNAVKKVESAHGKFGTVICERFIAPAILEESDGHREYVANLRLIAAAPELLEAAKKADEQMTQAMASWGGESQSMQDAINLVRAAILSATK